MTGAIPVFADIDSNTFCISPDSIKGKITDKTRAIIPAHIHYNLGLCHVAESVHPNIFVLSVLHPDDTEPVRQAEGLERAIMGAEGHLSWN
ncbi:MAG: DegT/DnrJ/EryC1/StrS family aminotransferase [Deltaproteobacteria bacterium]|nr:DegT/DnrJ/EryC1/StrS family aminotransferase [Deltaproteobacteria bacterium]